MNEKIELLEEYIKRGKRNDAVKLVAELAENENPAEILAALLRGMDDVGRRFKADEIFVPEVLISARAMKSCMEIIEQRLAACGLSPKHCVIIGTVEGDLHDIGKNLVAMMLKGANFKVVDLGVNVPAAKYCEAAKEHGAQIIAMSALLTTTMPAMQSAVEQLKAENIEGVKIIVGGAPVSPEYAEKIGAHGYSKDAASAVDLCRKLLNIAS